jgi:hypothetical protein
MRNYLGIDDRFALIHAGNEMRVEGLSSVEQALSDCGIVVVPGDQYIDRAACRAADPSNARAIRDWIKGKGITAIGFDCMLDPDDGLRVFSQLMNALGVIRAHASEGGPLRAVFFAGSPTACDAVEARFPRVTAVFRGDESPGETLDLLGIPRSLLPDRSARSIAYDDARMAFGRELVRKGEYEGVAPVDRSDYRYFGKRGDSLAARVAYGVARGLPPVIRADIGPYIPYGKAAFSLFLNWVAELASGGLLDVLSIETSRLSRSEFWRRWEGKSDGDGVPIDSPEEFAEAWRAARPMLVRSRAGTRDVKTMAQMLEETIDITWHESSLWWSSRLDGQGPNFVRENLREQVAALRYIAEANKPLEPDASRHFAARGADDLTQVLATLVAAKAAKVAGIQRLVLPATLDMPGQTWGITDLAKARALLHLVRELEDGDFKVYLQTTIGPDRFSRDPGKAKAQLAAATALMDDIEPRDPTSPHIIRVADYAEGSPSAGPETVNESVRIARQSLAAYRARREAGEIEDMSSNPHVLERTSDLIRETRAAISAIESTIAAPYGAEGLYEILSSGFFAAPFLSACRDEFPEAVHWKTRRMNGSIAVVDEVGAPILAEDRLAVAAKTARSRRSLPEA